MSGKTGTTQQHKSAAFVGFVPQMSGAVITFDNSNSPRPLCDGGGAPFACRSGNIFGGKTPAQTWFGAMRPLLEGQPVIPLPAVEERFLEGGAASRVPDVVGRGENDARAILERAGWAVSTRTVDNAAAAGHGRRAEPAWLRAPRRDDPAQREQRLRAAAAAGPVRRTSRPVAAADGGGGGNGDGTATATGTAVAAATVSDRGPAGRRWRSPDGVVRP